MREEERNLQDTCALSGIHLVNSKPDGSNICLEWHTVPQPDGSNIALRDVHRAQI